MRALLALLVASSLALIACGDAPKPVPAVATAATPKAAASRSALEALAVPGTLGILVDAKRFRMSPLFTAALVALDGTPFADVEARFERECGKKLFDSFGLVTFRSFEHEGLVAADTKLTQKEAFACVQHVAGKMKETRVADKPALTVALGDGEGKANSLAMVVEGGVLLFGTESLVARVLQASPMPPAARAELGLRDTDVGRIEASGDRVPASMRAVIARVTATNDDLSATVRMRTGGEKDAMALGTELTRSVEFAKAKLKKDGATEGAAIAESVRISLEGEDVVATLGTKGDAVAQTKYLANLVTVAQEQVRTYVRETMMVEARNVVTTVARRIVSESEREIGPKGKTLGECPASAPRVPKTTPKGEAYQSASSDWEQGGWKAVRFSLDMPQRYAYEIVTAKNKKSCKVIAHGDLDGNGRESTFELEVKFDRGRGALGSIVEKDPDE